MIPDHGFEPGTDEWADHVFGAAQPEAVGKVVPIDQLETLHRAYAALQSVTSMAQEAFERGQIFDPAHVPMIALAGKIAQEGLAGLSGKSPSEAALPTRSTAP